jgi:uncharacterized membrane protein
MSPLTRFVHVLALATYLGTTLAMVTVFFPALATLDDPSLQRRLLAKGLRPYNMLSVGALGVLIISGASALTDLKVQFGPEYARLIWPLFGKLGLTFLLTMVGTYVSFGIAHRLVRAEMGQLPIDEAQQRSMLKRMAGGCWLGVALAVWTSWVGLRLLH